MTYEAIKRNYERGLWNKAMVAIAVKKGAIGPEDYEKITGEAY